jgi:hypothetical protein
VFIAGVVDGAPAFAVGCMFIAAVCEPVDGVLVDGPVFVFVVSVFVVTSGCIAAGFPAPLQPHTTHAVVATVPITQ